MIKTSAKSIFRLEIPGYAPERNISLVYHQRRLVNLRVWEKSHGKSAITGVWFQHNKQAFPSETTVVWYQTYDTKCCFWAVKIGFVIATSLLYFTSSMF